MGSFGYKGSTIQASGLDLGRGLVLKQDTSGQLILTAEGTTVLTITRAGVSTPLAGGAFVTLTGTETLTNKTIDLANNTLTATSAQLRTAVTDETGTGVLVFGTTPTLTTPVIGAATGTSLAVTGLVTSSSSSAGIGYAAGAGGAVTQITSRTTGVTLNTITGAITTDTTSLAAEGTAEFTVTNSAVAVGDTVVACERSGSNSGGTIVFCSGVAAGSFNISVHNGNVAAGTAETGAIIINFAVIKAVST